MYIMNIPLTYLNYAMWKVKYKYRRISSATYFRFVKYQVNLLTKFLNILYAMISDRSQFLDLNSGFPLLTKYTLTNINSLIIQNRLI